MEGGILQWFAGICPGTLQVLLPALIFLWMGGSLVWRLSVLAVRVYGRGREENYRLIRACCLSRRKGRYWINIPYCGKDTVSVRLVLSRYFVRRHRDERLYVRLEGVITAVRIQPVISIE